VFLKGVENVEATEEEEVGDLFDDFQGIGYTSRPERIPDAVYLASDFTRDQCVRSLVVM
jgi:hypothetical protein